MLYLSKTTDILEGPVVCNYDLCFFQNKDHFREKQVLIMDLKLRFNTECINQGGSTSFRENTFFIDLQSSIHICPSHVKQTLHLNNIKHYFISVKYYPCQCLSISIIPVLFLTLIASHPS